MTLRLTAQSVFTALIVAFVFHNIEEVISICRYPVHSPVSFIQPANCRQFVVAVTIITALVLLAFSIAMHCKSVKDKSFIGVHLVFHSEIHAIPKIDPSRNSLQQIKFAGYCFLKNGGAEQV